MSFSARASYVEISTKALENNIRVFRNLAQGKFSIGVVLKGNAYGHGLETVFPVIQPWVDIIHLITAQDAFLLREIESKQGMKASRILVMGALSESEILECAKKNIETVLADQQWGGVLPLLRGAGLTAKVHIHVDTGLSREGLQTDVLEDDIEFLKSSPEIEVIGVMSHFANTEDVTEQKYAQIQIERLKSSAARIGNFLEMKTPLETHIAASAAVLVLPDSHLTQVRLGISLYGFWPSAPTKLSAKIVLHELPTLEPVLSWKCKSQAVKFIKKGTFVGYGCTYRCHRDTWIAILPVGYYDGYPRAASGKAHVLVQGVRCPVLGRIMMNHIIVDVTDVASRDDEVEAILIGVDGDEQISAEQLAAWSDTIQYETVTRIGAHLKRVLVT